MPRIALIHALAHSVDPINQAFEASWPEATRMNLLDDSLSADLAQNGQGLDGAMTQRFIDLTDYAVKTGAKGVLFTCSAFGPCIEAAAARHPGIPILKPNEAMIEEANAWRMASSKADPTIGLIASFAPTLVSMPPEFGDSCALDTQLVEDAMTALNAGDGATHDALVLAAARALAERGCGLIALAQFSMARAAPLVRSRLGLPVLTTPDTAIAKLKRLLNQ
ncbi:MAG: aspartate/glutamate racemase family protein [Burkholderiaceae bacterium]